METGAAENLSQKENQNQIKTKKTTNQPNPPQPKLKNPPKNRAENWNKKFWVPRNEELLSLKYY